MAEDLDVYHDVLRKFSGDEVRATRSLMDMGIQIRSGSPSSNAYNGCAPQNSATSSMYSRMYTKRAYESGAGARSSMTSGQDGHDVPPFFCCPISGEVMRDPVLLSSGRSYERRTIARLLELKPGQCPVSKLPVSCPPQLVADTQLRSNIEAWVAKHMPELLDKDSALKPAVYPKGIDAVLSPLLEAGAPQATLSIATNSKPNLLDSSLRTQSKKDLESADMQFARTVQDAQDGDESIDISVRAPHGVLPDSENTRHNVRTYALLTICVDLIWTFSMILGIGRNSWHVVSVSTNPWIGVDAEALLKSGAMCSGCGQSSEWWRLLTSLFTPAGISHGVSNSLTIGVTSYIISNFGIPVYQYIVVLTASGLVGSLLSTTLSHGYVHVTSSAVATASITASIAGIGLLWRRLPWSRATRLGTLLVLITWLVLHILLSLAPFTSAWTAFGGAITGCLCMVAFVLHSLDSKGLERSKHVARRAWQAGLTSLVAAICVALVICCNKRPENGWSCSWCAKLSCSTSLGWSCSHAYHNHGNECVFVFGPEPNPTPISIECVDQPTVAANLITTGDEDMQYFRDLCKETCRSQPGTDSEASGE